MKAHGPDGRVWTILRRAHPPHPLAAVTPGRRWLVEARTGNEVRLWEASSRREARQLIRAVALSLRTGAPSPAGELRESDIAARDAAEADRHAPSGPGESPQSHESSGSRGPSERLDAD